MSSSLEESPSCNVLKWEIEKARGHPHYLYWVALFSSSSVSTSSSSVTGILSSSPAIKSLKSLIREKIVESHAPLKLFLRFFIPVIEQQDPRLFFLKTITFKIFHISSSLRIRIFSFMENKPCCDEELLRACQKHKIQAASQAGSWFKRQKEKERKEAGYQDDEKDEWTILFFS